jgi:O-antigen/teichoic acid export membrane protein
MSNELGEVARVSARGSFLLFIGNASSTIILALGSIIVARLLGPENYGLYTIALITPSIFVALSDIGISSALTRFSARLRKEEKYSEAADLIRIGILFNSLFSLLLALILLLSSNKIAINVLKRPDLSILIQSLSIFLIGQSILSTVNSTLIGLDKMAYSGLLLNIQAIVKVVSSIALIILGLSTLGATLGAGLGFIIASGIGMILLLTRICPEFYRLDHSEKTNFTKGLKLMVKYGMPLYISALIGSLLGQYQNLILAQFVSNAEIGNWAIAMNLTVLVTLITYPIATSLFPAFSKIKMEEDRSSVEKMFKLSVKYSSLLVIPASMALAVLSKEAIYTLYGSQFSSAPNYLSLYITIFLCVGIGSFSIGNLFNGQGDTKTSLKINLVNFALCAVLAPILTLAYQVTGIIMAIIISLVLSTLYGLQMAHKKYGMSVEWSSIIRIIITSLLSSLLVYNFLEFTPFLNPVYRLAVGGVLYVISFLFMAPLLALSKMDLENLDGLFKEFSILYPIIKSVLNLEKRILTLKQNVSINSSKKAS